MRLVSFIRWPSLLSLGAALLAATALKPAAETPARHESCVGYCEILRRHAARYPRLELADAYKLLHQAVFGSEHAVADPEAARQWYEREVRQLGTGPEEPVFDPLSADGAIVRVHLRTYLAQGGDGAKLVDAFVRTANRRRGSTEQFRAAWACVEFLTARKALPFTKTDAETFLRQRAADGYPALHHSAAYVAAYRPAYRVVDRDLLPLPPAR